MCNIRKALIRVVLVILLVIGVQSVVRLCYEDGFAVTYWSKKERQELEGTIDTLYIGTSLTYYAFNPEILDAELGSSSFNLGTGSQPYIGNYYLIRDTAETNPIKHVYLTISLSPLLTKNTYRSSYVSAFENMRSWKWKLAYLTSVNREEVWMSSLFYSTQVKHYLALEDVKENLQNKLVDKEWPSNYGGRGYRIIKKKYKGRDAEENSEEYTWNAELGESQIKEQAMIYIEKIVEFCKEEGIELTLISLPYSQDFVDGGGDLDDFHQFFKAKAEEWDVDFYDFILYKDRETVFTNEYFKDAHHLNVNGGTIFSNLLAEVMQSENPQDYFYESLAEFDKN